jgi:hypothetical protein
MSDADGGCRVGIKCIASSRSAEVPVSAEEMIV